MPVRKLQDPALEYKRLARADRAINELDPRTAGDNLLCPDHVSVVSTFAAQIIDQQTHGIPSGAAPNFTPGFSMARTEMALGSLGKTDVIELGPNITPDVEPLDSSSPSAPTPRHK